MSRGIRRKFRHRIVRIERVGVVMIVKDVELVGMLIVVDYHPTRFDALKT